MRALAAILAVTVGAGVAHADTDYFQHSNDGSTIRIKRDKSRTTSQKLLIGGLLVGAAASIGVAVHFHLDSRDAADEVSANDRLTGETWTPALQDTYDRAGTSGTYAIVGYVVGALFLGGSVVAAWKTQPDQEQIEIDNHGRASITPIKGGILMARAWSW